MRALVVNVGSSSLKLSVLEGGRCLASQNLVIAEGALDETSFSDFIGDHGPISAVGHRVVHGGRKFTGPVVVDEKVRDQLEALVDLAPLHLPRSLAALDVVSRLLPGVPVIASFDTAFHAHIPEAARTYALPSEWRKRWDLRRFGFHGLSHCWAATRASELMGEPLDKLRIVTCHLGSGASLSAVVSGRSVDTTMGFTPLEGLVMATRSGNVDPGLLLWLEQHAGMSPDEVASALEHHSGLLALAGKSDMREILEAEAHGDPDAALAVAVYLHRLRSLIAGMAAAMGGLDALVFTGGVGEHAPSIRQRAIAGLEFLGLMLDEKLNLKAEADMDLSVPEANVKLFVIEAREDVQIYREICSTLKVSESARY